MEAKTFYLKTAFACIGFFAMHLHALAQQNQPNILVIFSDDHSQQAISAYGSNLMQTANIDRIANEGAIFQNTFVTNSICAPSRAVMLTGKYSHLNGLVDNAAGRSFDGSQQQVQKLLKNKQYQTAWIGKWHLQSLPQGFDYWQILPDQGEYYQPDFINMNNDTVRHKGYVTDVITDFTFDWLNQRDTTKPFFVVVGEKATHRSWMPDLQDLGDFDAVDIPLPENFYDTYNNRIAAAHQDMSIGKTLNLPYDLKVHANYNGWIYDRLTPEQRENFKNYYDKISAEYEQVKSDSAALLKWKFQRYLKDYLSTAQSLDRNIGRILSYLDSTGLARNTVVIYASDQGFYLGEHGWFDKRFMYEESLRTPFLMRYPGVIKPGTRVEQMVVNIDFAPTMLEIAGAAVPADMQGKSLLPLLTTDTATTEWRNEMFYHYYEYPEPHRVLPHFGVRTPHYKLIRFYGGQDAWELYDLQNDKSEMNNVYGKPEYDKVSKMLKQKLLELAVQYKDQVAVKLLQ